MDSIITRFFIFCSGASLDILVRCPDSETIKQSGIGGAVFFTSLFSLFSSYYAIFLITDSISTSILVGITWALMIFNLDRYLISSIRKNENLSLYSIAPRVFLGVLIAVSLAHPIELKIFESEINEFLNASNRAELEKISLKFSNKVDDINNQVFNEKSTINNDKNITTISKSIDLKKIERIILNTNTNKSLQLYLCECDGTCGTYTKGEGKECLRKKQAYFENKRNLEGLAKEIKWLSIEETKLLGEISKKQQDIDLNRQTNLVKISNNQNNEIKEYKKHFSDSLYARSKAFYELIDKDNLELFAFIIFLLFLMLEVTPILSKLLQPIGPYDIYLSEQRERAHRINVRLRQGEKEIDLSKEQDLYFKEIKKVMGHILEEWKTSLDRNKYSEFIHKYFDELYSSILTSFHINELNPNGSVKNNALKTASKKHNKPYLIIILIITLVMATLIPFIYFAQNDDIGTASNTALASGMFAIALITLLRQIQSKQQKRASS